MVVAILAAGRRIEECWQGLRQLGSELSQERGFRQVPDNVAAEDQDQDQDEEGGSIDQST